MNKTEKMTAEQYQQFLKRQAAKKKAKNRPTWKSSDLPPQLENRGMKVAGYGDITEIVIPGTVPSQNETNHEPFREKTKRRSRYERYIWATKTKFAHPGPVHLQIFRNFTGQRMDNGNLVGGAKQLVDALKNMGVIKDDTEEIIGKPAYVQIPLLKPSEDHLIIRIQNLPDGIAHL